MGFGKCRFVYRRAAECCHGGGGRRGRGNRCCRRGGGGSRFRGFGRRSRSCGSRTGGFHFDNRRTFGYFVAYFHQHGFNYAGSGTGDVHGRFIGFQRNQGVVDGNSVADFDFNGDDVHVFMAADVGNGNDFHPAGSGRCGSGCRSRGGGRSFDNRCGGRIGCGCGFHQQDNAAFGYFVAYFDFDFLNHAGRIGRHVHGRFVGFQRNQGVVHSNGVAGFNFYGDDVHVFMTADVGYFDFYDAH